jgi:hypothetical protein
MTQRDVLTQEVWSDSGVAPVAPVAPAVGYEEYHTTVGL